MSLEFGVGKINSLLLQQLDDGIIPADLVRCGDHRDTGPGKVGVFGAGEGLVSAGVVTALGKNNVGLPDLMSLHDHIVNNAFGGTVPIHTTISGPCTCTKCGFMRILTTEAEKFGLPQNYGDAILQRYNELLGGSGADRLRANEKIAVTGLDQSLQLKVLEGDFVNTNPVVVREGSADTAPAKNGTFFLATFNKLTLRLTDIIAEQANKFAGGNLSAQDVFDTLHDLTLVTGQRLLENPSSQLIFAK